MSSSGSGFLIIPAVDIRGGKCVRLLRGLADEETVFDEDPVNAALRWQEQGARLIHVVDLDGAFDGQPVNGLAVRKIASALDIPIEVGGGIRTTATATDYLEAGVARVVVGTAAFQDPEWLKCLAEALGERLAVGVDVKEGRVALGGWTGLSDEEPVAAVERLIGAGVRRIIYTDTMKDGTLEGPNIAGLEAVAEASSIPVVASGGVGAIDDILRISSLEGLGVEGVIVGMALYRGRFSLSEAIAALEQGGD